MFGFKYWVISIEIPRLINATKEAEEKGEQLEHKSICSERGYDVLNAIGIFVNLFLCVWVGWKRGMIDYITAFNPAPKQLGNTVMTLYTVITVLLIISAIFLADALRRLKKAF